MDKLKGIKEFSVMIKNTDPVTSCHQVYGVNILPGVCFLDMTYRALKLLGYPIGTIALRNMLFKLPLTTTTTYDRKVTFILEGKQDYLSLKASSKKVNNGQEISPEVEEHFECEILHADTAVPAPTLNLEQLMQDALSETDMEEVYSFTRKINVRHFEFMKGLGRTYVGKDYLLTRLHLSEPAGAYLNSFYLHPVFLDASTIIQFFFYSKSCNNEKPYIPFCIEHFQAYGPLPDICYVYMNKPEPADSLADVLATDYSIYDEAGRQVAVFRKLMGKQIRSEELIRKLINSGQENRVESQLNTGAESAQSAEKTLAAGEAFTDIEQIKAFLKETIAEIAAKKTGEIPENLNFYDIGLDSVKLLQLVKCIETRTGSQYYPTLLFEYQTIAELTDYLVQNKGIPLAAAAKEKDKTASEAGIVCLQDSWQETDLKRLPAQKPQNILLFDEEESLSKILAQRLIDETSHVILIKPGSAFRELGSGTYEIDPLSADDYRLLMETLLHSNIIPDTVIQAWNREAAENDLGGMEDILDKGIRSLFQLSKTIIKSIPQQSMQIIYLYPQNLSLFSPLHGAVNGFTRTLRLENPRLLGKTVAIPLGKWDMAEEKGDIIWQELGEKEDAEVLYDNEGKRFVKRFYEWQPGEEAAGKTFPLKEDGVYLITGGAGGLGLIFAEWLARRIKCRLVLVGRSPLNDQKREKLNSLTSLGAEAMYIDADISKRSDVENLTRKIKDQFTEINGVIHCAGVIRDALIINKTITEMNEVFAPKIYGTLLLDEFTAQEKLDFFIMLSSLSVVTGNPGQTDYAYANAFMDEFTIVRNQKVAAGQRSGKTFSINYPLWREGGMQVDPQTVNDLAEKGFTTLETSDGLTALETGFLNADNRIAVVSGVPDKIKALIGSKKDDRTKREESGEAVTKKFANKVMVLGNYERIKNNKNIARFWQKVEKNTVLPGRELADTYLSLVTEELNNMAHLLVSTSSGLDLETFVCGSGRPVLLIPPFGMSAKIWSYQAPEFSKHYRVIIINKPGHGLSSSKTNDLSLLVMAQGILEVMDALGVKEPIHLIGASFGGMIVQQFAIANPEKTASLVLSGSFSRLSPKYTSLSVEQAIGVFASLADKDLQNISGVLSLDKDKFRKIKDLIQGSMSLAPVVGIEYIARFSKVSTWENLPQIKASTLIVSGKEDMFRQALLDDNENQAMLSRLPKAELMEIADAGHFPYVTHWKDFNTKILSFFAAQEQII